MEIKKRFISRHYKVVVEGLCQVSDVEADTPKQALRNIIREHGIYNGSIRSISADTKTQYKKAKVYLLNGNRESVSYFEVSW